MNKIVQIVYVTDWSIDNQNLSSQDPFGEVLNFTNTNLSIQSHLPENFDDIDLLILHPMEMNPQIFEIISRSKILNPSIKTVVISSAHGSDLFLKAIDVGVDKYLLKPLLPTAVKKVVERLIQQSIETKQAQQAFKQINLMFGSISKTALVLRMEQSGKVVEVNSLLSKLIGISSEEMVGKHWMRFVEERFWVYLRTLVRARLQAGEIYRGIIEVVGVGNKTVTVDSTIYAVLDRFGEIEEIVFIGHDVSEMKQAILVSMKQLIDYDTSLAILFDHSYTAIMANRKFLNVKGYRKFEEFLNSCDLWAWMVETQHGLEPVLSKKSSQKMALETIVREVKKGNINGRIVSVDLNQNKFYYTVHMGSMPNPLIKNEQYHVLYFVDVTDFERHKEEKISDAKLMSVGRLAAAITHEINTPITYIKGNVELLKWECEDKLPEALNLFKPIDEGIERIESIVNSMYEFAGTGKEEIKPCSVQMTLVYALRIVYNRSKHIVPIKFNTDLFNPMTKYDETGWQTMGISTRLEQVWIIILNNALDEFEKGTITYKKRRIDVQLIQQADEIIVRIGDNAGGIPESMLEGIFDFSISGEKKKSMGIGLNVAKAIIDKHGGIIRVANDNQGAVFEIVLKIYEEKIDVF
ncbi:MAG: ATP-binding protein [Sulfuricurvum sp.]|nr:ATP-binding protein [Sulfuricurvum sp.]